MVIPIVLYLIWDRRDTLHGVSADPYPLAALLGVPLVVAWLLAERLGIMEGRQLVAMSFVELLFFVVLGPQLWWRLAGPLLYLYFLVPFGAFLTPKLQDFTTLFVGAWPAHAAYTSLHHRVHNRDPGRQLSDRRSLRRPAVPDRCHRIRLPLRAGDVPLRAASRGVHRCVDRRADHRQRFPRTRHRGAWPLPGQRRGGGGRSCAVWLDLLFHRHPDPDRPRTAVPRGSQAIARTSCCAGSCGRTICVLR